MTTGSKKGASHQQQYYHAHKVDITKCQGHMTCMRHCPTQAIRVRQGKAIIAEEFCVDCGICMAVCPENAIVLTTDTASEIGNYKIKVAVPSPVLYSQFSANIHPYLIHLALKQLGFDYVVDVNSAPELTRALIKYMKKYRGRLPLISSHCPAVLRLIQVKYPDLVELIVPIDVPREITARSIKETFPQKLGVKPEEIGITFIAPCPAKIVSSKQPAEKEDSWFDGAISINEIFSLLFPTVMSLKESFDESQVPEDFVFHAGWDKLGGITKLARKETWLAVSGIDHVIKTFDDIENSRLRNVDFIEALACMLGCISGPFNVENPYVARTNSILQKNKYEKTIKVNTELLNRRFDNNYYFMENQVLPRPTKFFDTDLATSIRRMKEREKIYQNLRQIDCGVCGAPTCMAFAEDVVKGQVKLTDCIFLSDSDLTDPNQ